MLTRSRSAFGDDGSLIAFSDVSASEATCSRRGMLKRSRSTFGDDGSLIAFSDVCASEATCSRRGNGSRLGPTQFLPELFNTPERSVSRFSPAASSSRRNRNFVTVGERKFGSRRSLPFALASPSPQRKRVCLESTSVAVLRPQLSTIPEEPVIEPPKKQKLRKIPKRTAVEILMEKAKCEIVGDETGNNKVLYSDVFYCCNNECMKQFTLNQIDEYENIRAKGTVNDLKERLARMCIEQRNYSFEEGKFVWKHHVLLGRSVCKAAFWRLNGIRYPQLYQRICDAAEYAVKFNGGAIDLKCYEREGKLRDEVKEWIENFTIAYGEDIPLCRSRNSKGKVAITISPFVTFLHQKYTEAMLERKGKGAKRNGEIAGYQWFRKIFKNDPDFRAVVLNSVKKHYINVCSICVKLATLSSQSNARSFADCEELTHELAEHHALAAAHRDCFTKARKIANVFGYRREGCPTPNWEDHMDTLILDGMDQAKLRIPQFTGKVDKDKLAAQKFLTHITGGLLYSCKANDADANVQAFMMFDYRQFPHGANLVINSLLFCLANSITPRKSVLYVQLDNCARENKNRYVMNFAALLVELNIYRMVIIHFHLVGHTHEIIDKEFQTISTALQKYAVHTIPELLGRVQEAVQSSKRYTKVHVFTEMVDVVKWMEKFVEVAKIQNITNKQFFKFVKDEEGIVRMFVKDDPAENAKWYPNTEDEDYTLADDPDLKFGFKILEAKKAPRKKDDLLPRRQRDMAASSSHDHTVTFNGDENADADDIPLARFQCGTAASSSRDMTEPKIKSDFFDLNVPAEFVEPHMPQDGKDDVTYKERLLKMPEQIVFERQEHSDYWNNYLREGGEFDELLKSRKGDSTIDWDLVRVIKNLQIQREQERQPMSDSRAKELESVRRKSVTVRERPLTMIQIGKQRRADPTRPVNLTGPPQDYAEPGTFVACVTNEVSLKELMDCPWIARVVSVNKDTAEVAWLKRKSNKKWVDYYEDQETQEVPVESIVLFSVVFTADDCIDPRSLAEIRKIYKEVKGKLE